MTETELCQLAEQYLGARIQEGELAEAWAAAARKLEWIVSREGDADGVRSTAAYFAQLMAEAVNMKRFSKQLG